MFIKALPAIMLAAGIFQGGPGYFPGGAPRVFPPREFAPPREFGPREFALPAPQIGGACLSLGEARAAMLSGQVVPLSSVLGQIQGGGQIISAPLLCNRGGRLMYFLDVLSGGRIVHMQVDAQTGSISQ